MKIRSKFRDYYDFVGHQYYDADPLDRVWVRNFENVDEEPLKGTNGFAHGYTTVHVIIGDREYHLLMKERENARIYAKDRLVYYAEFIYSPMREFSMEKIVKGPTRWNKKDNKEEIEYLRGKKWFTFPEKDQIRKLQMKYQTPIILSTRHEVCINPKLADIGFASLIDPYSLHQELKQWFTDGKFDAPPPEAQTNVGKILSHGFDLVKSFRHRK